MTDPRELLDAYAAKAAEGLTFSFGEGGRLLAALWAVLEVHAPSEYMRGLCDCCSEFNVNIKWPCRTVQAIVRALEGK